MIAPSKHRKGRIDRSSMAQRPLTADSIRASIIERLVAESKRVSFFSWMENHLKEDADNEKEKGKSQETASRA